MKELKDKIELTLLPEDFEDTSYTCMGDCAISKAAKRYGIKRPHENINRFAANYGVRTEVWFKHNYYGQSMFEDDMKTAASSNFRGKEPIRTIVLNRVK